MNGGLSATEALLSHAAAVTSEEVFASRLALIGTGGEVVKPMDRSLLVSGDGSAGRQLLGGDRQSVWQDVPGPSCAIRSSRLMKAPPPVESFEVAS